ncbi:MAG: YqgE/AlgH family protein [Acidimicrobiales bacterium]|nr:YqgE/AlgH family protein [Acidimicrobiales bacterium]HRW37492.1 YqgE/AlgH family protein [Aquihabitans sp.]
MTCAGRLLVATPLIGDPTFERTVVLVLAHGPDGAFGVVLNRPSETRVEEIAPEWAPLAEAPGVVFVGGPVGRDAVLGLGRSADLVPQGDLVIGGCTTVDLHRAPDDPSLRWSGVRLYAGSAGWTSGQLDDEVAEGAWWVVDVEPADLLTADPDGLWRAVLHRQRGEVAWFANHPPDPSAN